ncbi:MAG: glycosyltransferase family 2 protein [bacterium]|nr:glycosyltransferase family 2 protein [bacterium]
MRLSIVLPCYNEEANITSVVADCDTWFASSDVDGEIVAVDDGSNDNTAQVLRSIQKHTPRLQIVTHEGNKGYGFAVRSGCDAAKEEYISFMDSDGQFKAKDFEQLLPCLAEYKFVTGKRRKRADPAMRKLNALLYGVLIRFVLGVKVHDINCAMKVFQRDIWQNIRPETGTGALFNGEVFLRLKKKGIEWKQVEVSHYPRTAGIQTGAKPGVILRMFRELLELRKSVK